ncbi:RsmB/NOP family class I SAM-dependent RNA methyltransferase [Devosia sp. ZB163]|uniref:RsmB/NOP family class I SAM-dependent RNA methyltransferase n=1 Tax=Devosia sp. ZB163 TaxID=3025938 RepID=UPI00235F81AD|nr:RsmB/NOP family class I SAM-dependent RNA methyltransferase [Devosia sp. ZB163]MDC9822230.1 RsmB/NOP family class I SAM-dependent RNA methyltransferase [Devosia sp. ZB163]
MKKQKNPPGLALRLLAAEKLGAVLKGANFAPFSVADIADGRDRALANRLVTTALRRHGQINLMLARYLDRGVPKKSGSFEAILRLSLAHLVFLPELGDHSAIFLAVEATKRDTRSQHLSKLTNAVLRRAQAEAHSLRHLPHEALFPETLGPLWRDTYGEDAIEDFADALIEGAPLDLTLKDTDPELIEALRAEPVLGDTVRIDERDRPVEALPGYTEGRWWVQDAAAAIPARLLTLAPGARVLDLCAAPGGKTAQLVKAGYVVTAVDNDADRVGRMQQNLERLGYAPEVVTADALAWEPGQKFDGILLDAPCSATGTFRRHPEVIWHRDAADIAGRVALQRRFIERALSWLNPGGLLVYCVCSLEPAEGEEQARWLFQRDDVEAVPVAADELAAFPEAVSSDGYVRTHPGMPVPGDKGGTLDGFFVARARRR